MTAEPVAAAWRGVNDTKIDLVMATAAVNAQVV